MYAQSKNMPCSPGIFFEKRGSTFWKRCMGASNSLGAVQYLEYCNEYSEFLKKRNGERVPLEHQYYRGEYDFQGKLPDGYASVDDKNVFFEYNGSEFDKILILI